MIGCLHNRKRLTCTLEDTVDRFGLGQYKEGIYFSQTHNGQNRIHDCSGNIEILTEENRKGLSVRRKLLGPFSLKTCSR